MKIERGWLIIEDDDPGAEVRVFCGLCNSRIERLEFDGDITVICESCRHDYSSAIDTIYKLEERLEELQADNQDLKIENERLQIENERLQDENERLQDENVNVRHNIETQGGNDETCTSGSYLGQRMGQEVNK